ncbi:MAG: CDP-alcohol phosphatidyltransferase family protein [Kofleriaceae bacterium]|nr:CDP-alcohol phosphatidyltransferase family protein [Kofleriaceae bacterium]
MHDFDAVIVAVAPSATARVLGLSLVERGRRVAKKLGARRIYTVDCAAAATGLGAWDAARGDAALLVLEAGDQVVHLPLAEPLVRGSGATRLAVEADGAYAGALWAEGSAASEVVQAIAASPERGGKELAAAWSSATRIPHGDIARHAATTPEERRGATQMLLRLIIKHEDSAITNYIYRPLSRPLTRMLVWTPITPNQVSIAVLLIGMLGCWIVAHPGAEALVVGCGLVLAAGIIDGCDGEIARLKLNGSKAGAWLDTIVDEMTTMVLMAAVGYHTYLHHPHTWVAATIVLGVGSMAIAVYGIYYFLIVVSKTGNSQHYVGDLEIVDDGGTLALRKRVKPPSTAPRWLIKAGELLMLVVRRDFVNLASFIVACFNGYAIIFATTVTGSVITSVVVAIEHVKLRKQLRELARRGGRPRLLAA